jgi:hypothetical protein
MRKEVKYMFRKFTSNSIEDLITAQDEDPLLQVGGSAACRKTRAAFRRAHGAQQCCGRAPGAWWLVVGGWWL